MASKLVIWRDAARELGLMLGLTILGLAALSGAAVLLGTMPAFIAVSIRGLH